MTTSVEERAARMVTAGTVPTIHAERDRLAASLTTAAASARRLAGLNADVAAAGARIGETQPDYLAVPEGLDPDARKLWAAVFAPARRTTPRKTAALRPVPVGVTSK